MDVGESHEHLDEDAKKANPAEPRIKIRSLGIVPAVAIAVVLILVMSILVHPVLALAPSLQTAFITINSCGIHSIGEEFFINGTTNLAVSHESLLLQIDTTEFNPGGFASSFYTANVFIHPGDNGVNVWSAKILPSRWQMLTESPNHYQTPVVKSVKPGNYQVVLSSKNLSERDSIATQPCILVLTEPGNNYGSVQRAISSENITRIPEETIPHPATLPSASETIVPGIALVISVVVAAGSRRKKDDENFDKPG